MIQNTEPPTDESLQRAAAYEFLSSLWCSELDDALLSALSDPSGVRNAFIAAGGNLSELDQRDMGADELAEDFCQLFLGPTNHLPPYQSVWVDGQFAGDSSVEMKKWCELVQFESTAIEPDQLGVQLAVMSRIAATAQVRMEMDFFGQHLRWPTKLLIAAAQRARTSFYHSVATMTAAFLDSEATRLLQHGEI